MKTLIIIACILIFIVLPILFVVGCCMVAGKSARIIEGLMDETHEGYEYDEYKSPTSELGQ